MAFTEFYSQNGGSNINSGTTTNNTAAYTALNGNWSTVTHIYTPTDGSTPSNTVSVGDFASIYGDGASVAVYIARIITVAAGINGAITVSSTAFAGTAPTTSASGRSIKVGGAWGFSTSFPIGSSVLNNISDAMNVAGNKVRVNLRNDQTYSYTAQLSIGTWDSIVVQGYSTTPGDGGKATVTTTSTTNFAIIWANTDNTIFADLIIANTASTGTADLFTCGDNTRLVRCVFKGSRGSLVALQSGAGYTFIECEFYDFNKSNTANKAAIATTVGGSIRTSYCMIRDGSGSNCRGIYMTAAGGYSIDNTIIHGLGSDGVYITSPTNSSLNVTNCDFYNNGGDAIKSDLPASGTMQIKNNNFVKNTGHAINVTTLVVGGFIDNNGYGSGTMANGSADVTGALIDSGTAVTYAANIAPWVDPATGDFRINNAQANWAGRGAFTQADPNFGNATVGYPDIGAAQSKTGTGGTFTKASSHTFGG